MHGEEPDVTLKRGINTQNGIQDRSAPPEQVDIVLVDEGALREAQDYVIACEHCDANSGMTFDYLLDEVMGCEPTRTEYLMCRSAQCTHCDGEVTEKTLVIA